jgi:Flp pilus assembly protein TadG
MVKLVANLISNLTRFASDVRAVAAVEFAAVLPFLVLLALGTVELSDGITAKQKLTHVISSTGDLVAQSKVITNTDMTNLMKAAAAIIAPFPDSKLKVIVSGISIDANANPKVSWSDGHNTDPLQIGTDYTVPPDLKVANTFLIVAEGSFTYTPTVAYVLSGDVKLQDRFFMLPRLVNKVCRPPQTAQNC